MRITYVMMQYPLPTQTFAISDIASLRSLGHEVSIECLLPASRRQKRLCATYQLDRGHIHNAGIGGYLFGIPLVVKYLIENRSFFALLFRELLPRPKRLVAFLFLMPRIVGLVSSLSRQRPDVVHAFWGHWPSVVPALLKRYAPSVDTSMYMGAYDLYVSFPLRLTAEAVDNRFTHSTSNLPHIRSMGVTDDVHMIHRGIPLADLSALDAGGNPIQKTPLQFCTASALTKDKQVDVSLRVFALIRRAIPNASLVVIGDGAERRYLEEFADELGVADAVSFVGYQKRQDLFRIMCGSQFFLFFSRKASERLPNVVKEAMLAKCVCFVSDTQGIDELIPVPDYGIVFEDADCETIAQEIMSVLDDASRLHKIGENAHSMVASHFSSDSAMKKYVEIWTGHDPGGEPG